MERQDESSHTPGLLFSSLTTLPTALTLPNPGSTSATTAEKVAQAPASAEAVHFGGSGMKRSGLWPLASLRNAAETRHNHRGPRRILLGSKPVQAFS